MHRWIRSLAGPIVALGMALVVLSSPSEAPAARADDAPFTAHLPLVLRGAPVYSDLQVTGIMTDGVEPTHQSDEYVTLQNTGAFAIPIAGWQLHAQPSGTIFDLPAMWWMRGLECRVYTDQLLDTDCGFSFASPVELWPASGGCAVLFNQDHVQMSSFCYP